MIAFWFSIFILVIGLALKNNSIKSLAYFLIFMCVILSLADIAPKGGTSNETTTTNINETLFINESLSIIMDIECNYTRFKVTLDEIECKDEEMPESNNSIFIRFVCEPHLRLTINYCYDGRESNVVTIHGEELIMDLKNKLNEKVKT